MENIEIVNKYTEFNQLIYNKEIEKAFEYIKNNDIKFSGIDKYSNNCFDAIKEVYRSYNFSIKYTQKADFNKDQLNTLYEMLLFLLDKEPQYYYKRSDDNQYYYKRSDDKYYFLQLFIDFKDIDRFKYFYKMIESVKPSEMEKLYFNKENREKEMLDIVWQNKSEKITIEEIQNTYYNSNIEEFIKYVKDINKTNRKIAYKHDDLKSFLNEIRMPKATEDQFLELYKEFNNIFKNQLSKDSVYISNPKYPTKFHELLSNIISKLNYALNNNYGISEPYNKKITLDLLEYANTQYPSNDYISKFDIIRELGTSNIIIEKEGYDINKLSQEWKIHIKENLHSLFTFLLLPKNQKGYEIVVEESIERLLDYKERYPNEFYNDYIKFKNGFDGLNIEIKNVEINKIILYFDLLYMEKTPENKVKKFNKI